jgi:hypothetical protein
LRKPDELTDQFLSSNNLLGEDSDDEVQVESEWGQLEVNDESVFSIFPSEIINAELIDHASFDKMGLKKNLLKGVYAYG